MGQGDPRRQYQAGVSGGHVLRRAPLPLVPAKAGTQEPSTMTSPRLGPRFRGGERSLRFAFYSVVKQHITTSEISESQRNIGPCFGFGPGVALIPLYLTTLYSRGMARRQGARPGSPGRRWLGLRPGLGVKRHAPRLAARQRGIFGLRLSQRSGRTRSYLSLEGYSRGRPWVRLA